MKCSAILALMTGFVFTQAHAQQNDWANFGKYATSNTEVKQEAQKNRDVVFMGNSITEFWYANDSLFFKENKYINRGISGQTTSQMLVRFRKDVIELHPKLVVILAGTNDIAGNTGYISLENILGNIASMAELAKAHHIKVMICSVLPAYDYPWSKGKHPNVKIPELNAMIKAYAAKNKFNYLDYFSAMADDRNGLPKKLANEGVHPNLQGYKLMEGIVKPAIDRLLR